MHYNVVCCNVDCDSLEEEVVSYSFSNKKLAEDCQKMLRNVYQSVDINEVEFDTYKKPHKLYHARLSLATGQLTSIGFGYTYQNQEDVDLMNYSYNSILYQPYIGTGEIVRYSLESESDAERKCREIYAQCIDGRTLVYGPYNSQVWVRNELLDDNLFYRYNDYLVDGKTGMIKDYGNKKYENDFRFLEIRCSG